MINRIVFEKGIEIQLSEVGLWYHQTVHDRKLGTTPEEVTRKYGVRPILIAKSHSHHPSGELRHLLLSSAIGSENIEQLVIRHDLSSLTILHGLSLSHAVGSVYYHCLQLAELYSMKGKEYAKSILGGETQDCSLSSGELSNYSYYELEALITSARRSYNTTRYYVWKALDYKHSMPSSFEKMLNCCDRLPIDVLKRLELSWNKFGCKLRDYRDYIEHYLGVSDRKPYAIMQKLEDGVWSTSIRIPDDPKVESPESFRYDCQLDALTYGWELTNEIIAVAQIIVQQIPVRD